MDRMPKIEEQDWRGVVADFLKVKMQTAQG